MNSNLTKTHKFENFHVSPIICGVCVYHNNHGGTHASNLTYHRCWSQQVSGRKKHSSTLASKKHSNMKVFLIYLQICIMNININIYKKKTYSLCKFTQFTGGAWFYEVKKLVYDISHGFLDWKRSDSFGVTNGPVLSPSKKVPPPSNQNKGQLSQLACSYTYLFIPVYIYIHIYIYLDLSIYYIYLYLSISL